MGNNFDIEENKTRYPYAKWMLEEIKDEYAVENDRENKIASKASAFITVVVAIITLYIPMIPFDKMKKFFNCSTVAENEKIMAVNFLVMLGFGFILFVIAFIVLIFAYAVKEYNRVCVDDLIKNSVISENDCEESVLAQAVAAHYYKILRGTIDRKGNIKINTRSANAVTIGIICTVSGFVALSIATIALRVLIV